MSLYVWPYLDGHPCAQLLRMDRAAKTPLCRRVDLSGIFWGQMANFAWESALDPACVGFFEGELLAKGCGLPTCGLTACIRIWLPMFLENPFLGTFPVWLTSKEKFFQTFGRKVDLKAWIGHFWPIGLSLAVPILLGLALVVGRHYTYAPIAVTSDQPDYVQIQGIPYFVQHDSQWAGERLGGSQETLAEAGCTLVCVAMALHRLGFDWTPGQLCQRLKTAGGFTKRGHLIWQKLSTVTDGRVKVRFPPLSHAQIGRELAAGRPVIAKIMLSGSAQHWVLIIGQEGSHYWALDPLSRDQEPVKLEFLSQKIEAIRVLQMTAGQSPLQGWVQGEPWSGLRR